MIEFVFDWIAMWMACGLTVTDFVVKPRAVLFFGRAYCFFGILPCDGLEAFAAWLGSGKHLHG
jgi:hypothetical protein